MTVHGGGPWTRRDWGLAAAAAAAAAAPRAVLRGRGVHDLDSILLSLGVRSYDFASYHPHPPYHPLTIAAAKLLAPFVGPALALTWVSVVAIAVLAVAVFGVGRALGGRLVGAAAAGLVALSPLATENAGVALSYVNEPAALAVVALLALHARRRRDRLSWVLLGIAASAAVGVRPSAAITAGPLILWAVGRDLRALLTAAAAGATATLAWLVPTVAAGGGWGDFRYGTSFQTRHYVLHDPVWVGGGAAVRNHVAWLLHHVRAELPWLLAVAVLALVAAVPLWFDRQAAPRSGRWLLVVWMAPTLLFYGFVYGGWPMFHSGYALGVLPPAFVAAPLALRRTWQAVRARLDAGALRAATRVVLVLLAAWPMSWTADWPEALEQRQAIDAWTASWEGLEDVLPPDRTALFGGYSAHWALLEHPEYLVWALEMSIQPDGTYFLQIAEARDGKQDKPFFDNVRDGPDAPHPIPGWVEQVVLVAGHPNDGVWPALNVSATREVELRGGARVLVFDTAGLQTIEQVVPGYLQMHAPSRERTWPPR